MVGVPLVNTNSVNDINTSIIAIKKEMKSSGETEVNVNVNLPETAIPVDEVTSGNMHSVTSNAVANSMSYSTSEINTGKKWIDGKPIYRKVISTGQLPNNTTNQLQHGIVNLGKITDILGVAFRADGVQIPIPFQSGSSYVVANIYNAYLQVTSTADYSGYSECYVTIEYTKTTD